MTALVASPCSDRCWVSALLSKAPCVASTGSATSSCTAAPPRQWHSTRPCAPALLWSGQGSTASRTPTWPTASFRSRWRQERKRDSLSPGPREPGRSQTYLNRKSLPPSWLQSRISPRSAQSAVPVGSRLTLCGFVPTRLDQIRSSRCCASIMVLFWRRWPALFVILPTARSFSPTSVATRRCHGSQMWVSFAHRSTANPYVGSRMDRNGDDSSLAAVSDFGLRGMASARGDCGLGLQVRYEVDRGLTPGDAQHSIPAFGMLAPFSDVRRADRDSRLRGVLGGSRSVNCVREAEGQLLLAPDPGSRSIRWTVSCAESGDGVGHDVRAETPGTPCAVMIFSVAAEQDRLGDQLLAVGHIDGGRLIGEPDHELAEVLLGAAAHDVGDAWSNDVSNFARSVLVNFCDAGGCTLNAVVGAGVRSWPARRRTGLGPVS